MFEPELLNLAQGPPSVLKADLQGVQVAHCFIETQGRKDKQIPFVYEDNSMVCFTGYC